jgi:pilus assembly protein Flp/PilA
LNNVQRNKNMMTKLYVNAVTLLSEFKRDERGVTAIEYGLIAAAMAAALAATFGAGGDIVVPLQNMFKSVVTALGGTNT